MHMQMVDTAYQTRRGQKMFVIIDDEFTKHGLTLDEAYILYRVKSFEKNGMKYHESADALAKLMGKSRRAVNGYINSLVEKGYLKREYRTKNTRYLIVNIDSVKNLCGAKNAYAENAHAELEKASSINGLSLEEKVQRMQEALQMNKDPNYDSTEEL